MAKHNDKENQKRNIALAVLDTTTLGIPVSIGYLIKQPKKAFKPFLITFPIVATITYLILSI